MHQMESADANLLLALDALFQGGRWINGMAVNCFTDLLNPN